MINAAIVGLGAWGRSLVDGVQGRSQKLRFTRGVSRNPGALTEFSGKHALPLSPEYAAVLADPSIDAVVLATPHLMHADQVVAAAKAGKHVFCEKPLAMTRDDALRAVRACEDANRVLGVGHNKRFWASMVALREIVAGGSLGQILHVEGHSSNQNSGNFSAWRENPEEAPGGGMTGSGIHVLDAVMSVGGAVAALAAQLLVTRAGKDPRDTVSVVMDFKTGMSGTLACVRATPMYWRVHVFGDQGSVESLSETHLIIRRSGGVIERKDVTAYSSVLAEMDAFADAVDGRQAFPISNDDSVNIIAAFEGIVTSIRTREWVHLL